MPTVYFRALGVQADPGFFRGRQNLVQRMLCKLTQANLLTNGQFIVAKQGLFHESMPTFFESLREHFHEEIGKYSVQIAQRSRAASLDR
jgi:hypothetical protein